MRVLIIFCLAMVALGTHARDTNQVDRIHFKDEFGVGTGVSTDDGKMKRVDDIEDVHRGFQRPDDPKPVLHTGQVKPHLKPVNLKPELENKKMGKGRGRKDRLRNKPKSTLKRPNKRQFRPKRPIQKKSNKRITIRVNSKGGRKNRKMKPVLRKTFKPRSNKRQLRKLQPRDRQTIVDRIVEDHKKGKASSVSTTYLQNRIRALLEQQGFVARSKCKGKNKLKRINERKRLWRNKIIANRSNRKQPRTLKPRLVIKNKNVPKKNKTTMKNKVVKVKTGKKKNKNSVNIVVKKINKGRQRKNKGRKGLNNKKGKKPKIKRKPKANKNNINIV